jgi:hypothetical protein
MHEDYILVIRRHFTGIGADNSGNIVNLFLNPLRLTHSLDEPFSHFIQNAFLIPIKPKLHASRLANGFDQHLIALMQNLKPSFGVFNGKHAIYVGVGSFSELDQIFNQA